MKRILFIMLLFAGIVYAGEKEPLKFVPKAKTQIGVLRELFYWIPKNIKYDDKWADGDYSPNYDTTAEIVLSGRKGVCLGYSLVFQKYVKEYLKLPCYVLTLDYKKWSGRHAINKVWINDEWYYFDVTEHKPEYFKFREKKLLKEFTFIMVYDGYTSTLERTIQNRMKL